MMTSILQNLKGMTQRSENVEYLPLGLKGVYAIHSRQDLDFLSQVQSYQYLKIDFDFKKLPLEEDFKIGESYSYKVTVKIPETKSNFFSSPDYLIDYILGQTEIIDWSSKIILPFDQDFHPAAYEYKSHFIYLNRLICLYKKYTYWDSGRFVLFTDKPFLVPLIRESCLFQKFKICFDKIKIKKFEESIEYLEEFLDGEVIKEHKKEKQSIFIMESSKILGSQVSTRFYNLIQKIDEIKDSVDKSFKIYIENFSYQRLELELKKDLDHFVKSINDSIGVLQTQALGLPIAAGLMQFSKLGANTEESNLLYTPYIALIVFSFFVVFNVYQQSIQVEYVKASIVRFFKKDVVSSVLGTEDPLTTMKNLIDKRIFMINIYMATIILLAVVVILYGLYEIGLLT